MVMSFLRHLLFDAIAVNDDGLAGHVDAKVLFATACLSEFSDLVTAATARALVPFGASLQNLEI